MKRKESWREETMNSLDGIGRATPHPTLLHPRLQMNDFTQPEAVPAKPSFYWTIAAGIAILVSLNVLGALYYHHAQNLSQQAPAAIANDYLSYLGPIKL